MNVVVLMGRLTRDPELRHTSTGKAVATFNLAIRRPFSNIHGKRQTDFINVVAWSKLAENVAKYMTKGRQVAVEGRLQTRSYAANDGSRRWITEVVASHVIFVDPPRQEYEVDEDYGGDFGADDSDGFDPFEAGDNDLPF